MSRGIDKPSKSCVPGLMAAHEERYKEAQETITRLQSEVERLQKQLSESEQNCRDRIKRDRIYCMEHGDDAAKEMALRAKQAEEDAERLRGREDALWETFVKVADFLGIDCEEARKIPSKPSSVFQAAIIRKQAEAVKSARDETCSGSPMTSWHWRVLTDYAQRLRQQAAESE